MVSREKNDADITRGLMGRFHVGFTWHTFTVSMEKS